MIANKWEDRLIVSLIVSLSGTEEKFFVRQN